jgi:two-component system, LuxR family, response regulator FixJ
LSNRTVFVVDDDEAVRDSLRWLISSVNLEVETFASAQDFLSAFDPQRQGCLLLDMRMPGMSGLALLTKLRELGSKIPTIILTGHGDVPMAVRALKTGAIDFLEKPYNDQALLDCIHNALEQSAQIHQLRSEQRKIEMRFASLTPREQEVMTMVVKGLSNKQIGNNLSISIKTVETHRARIMEKMEADSVSHLVRMAVALEH